MQVIGRPRGATLILPCIMRGATILASFLMQGFFNVQESKGDLTLRVHYLNSPPIEEFWHSPEKFRGGRVDQDSNPRLRAQRQARSLLSHPRHVILTLQRASVYDGYSSSLQHAA